MRPPAQVDKIALAVQRNVFIGGDAGDDLGLVRFAHVAEKLHRLVTRHHATLNRDVFFGQLGHFLLDGLQIFWRKRALVGEIVKEAVFNHRPDGHLRIRKQRLHRIRQQMRGGVANHVQPIGILVGDDGKLAVDLHHKTGIHQLAVNAPRQRRLGQASANIGSDFGNRYRFIETAY